MVHVLQQALGRGRLEQLRVVLQLALKAVRLLDAGERQVELRRLLRQRHPAHRQPGQLHLQPPEVLHHEHDAEVPAALGGLEVLEGHVLVREGLQRHLPRAAQQLAHGGVAGQAGAQHQGVEEEADQALHLRVVAAGDGRAHHDVVLPGVAAQHELERRQHRHERGDALALAQLRERGGHVAGQLPADIASRVSRLPGTGEVGGQLQLGRAGELLPPPLELGLQRLALQPLALPRREVAVVHRRLGQRRGLSRGKRGVEGGELAHEHAHGPAVGDDVVHRHQQHVPPVVQPQQDGAQQRAGGQVEGACGLPGAQPERLGLAVLTPGEVHHGQGEGRWRVDDLEGRAALVAERGAQRLVATHHLREGVLQRLGVQRTFQAQRGGDVEGGRAGLELLEEPQALLCERQRRRPTSRRAPGDGGRGVANHLLLELLRQLRALLRRESRNPLLDVTHEPDSDYALKMFVTRGPSGFPSETSCPDSMRTRRSARWK